MDYFYYLLESRLKMLFTNLFLIRCLQTNPKHGIVQRIKGDAKSSVLSHIVQIGDPVLRKVAQPVDMDRLKSSEIQNIISQMRIALKKYDAHGIAAPQLGVPVRMFAVQVTEKQINKLDDDTIIRSGVKVIPFKVFINPVLKYIGSDYIVEKEGCKSMNGYQADVKRHKYVNVTGHNENGERVSWDAKDWDARLVQHEMDHLDGILYTDKMHSPESLEFRYWKTVNAKSGAFRLPFGELPGWKQYYYVLPILMLVPVPIVIEIYRYYKEKFNSN